MGNLGETLKAARDAKGVSLQEAEAETKIRMRYLEALETEELHIIPGLVYTKGFLKTYANYLGLDQEQVMTEFRLLNVKEEPLPARRSQVKYKSYTAPRRRKKLRWKPSFLTVALAVAAIVTLFLFNNLWSNDSGSAVKQPQNKAKAVANKDNASGQKKPQQPTGGGKSTVPDTVYGNSYKPAQNDTALPNLAPGQQLNMVLTTKDQSSWVRIVSDGVQKFSGTMTPGQVQTVSANDKIDVRLGNAGAVEITYNGQNLGYLGPTGKVVEQEFTRVATSVYTSP